MNQKPIDIDIAPAIDTAIASAVAPAVASASNVPITPDPVKVETQLRFKGMRQIHAIDIAIESAIGLDTSELDPLNNEHYAAECRSRIKYERGDKSHLMFRQWAKVVCACTCPWDKRWHLFGGKGIFVDTRWLDFSKFVVEMQDTFEFRPDKPATLRNNYLSRRNNRAGFNKANAIWVTKAEVMTLQSRTKTYPTPFGRPGSPPVMMSLTEISNYMTRHAGEEWPDGRTYTLHVREFNAADKLQTVAKTITTIQPVSMGELRRRLREGRDLFRPVRPYGDKAEVEREMDSETRYEARRDEIEATRQQREELRLAKLRAALGEENVKPPEPKPEIDLGAVSESVAKDVDGDIAF